MRISKNSFLHGYFVKEAVFSFYPNTMVSDGLHRLHHGLRLRNHFLNDC